MQKFHLFNLIPNLIVGNEAISSCDIQPVQAQSDLEEGMNSNTFDKCRNFIYFQI